MNGKESEAIRKIADMTETLVKMRLSEILAQELTDSGKKKLYDLTGKANVTRLVKVTGFSAGKISAMWQDWYLKGILKKDGKSYKKIFD